MKTAAYLCDFVRTPVGRFGGALARLRPDDMAAAVIDHLLARHPQLAERVDGVVLGCSNQAGEDNRNVARMATLLSKLPETVPAYTVNRLCASGLDAVASAARMIKVGEAELVLAGGVESMSRAPFVMAKAEQPYQRTADIFDTTIGWRFINPAFKEMYGCDSMPETGETVASEFGISREDQDAFALRSQQRTEAARQSGFLAADIVATVVPGGKAGPQTVHRDEHPRPDTTSEQLARLRPIVRPDGTVTAGNASGVNDGAAVMVVASEAAVAELGLTPRARVLATVAAGVPPRIMGLGPVAAVKKVLAMTGLELKDIDVLELNEAFASQSLACLRELGLPDDAAHVNPNGGAIALGHPLGMSGARILGALVRELETRGGRYGIATLCVGVGQGVAMVVER